MKATGIIVEYNPFHKGHQYHIEKAKVLCPENAIIAVMSGNFVQRGEPAMFDKYLRTKAALLNGVDMVLELPVFFATASAQYFANAAITILNATGITDRVCFGSESGLLEPLAAIAETIYNEPPPYKAALHKSLTLGMSYPSARRNALYEVQPGLAPIADLPNNILAIEYINALTKIHSSITPYSIGRSDDGYHSTRLNPTLSSATAIRRAIRCGKWEDALGSIPGNLHSLYKEQITSDSIMHDFDSFYQILQYLIKTSPPNKLAQILDVNEGLENRIIHMAYHKANISEMINTIKTKRFTYTRIARAMLHILLDIKSQEFEVFLNHGGPQYIRVLGFRKQSEGLFTQMSLHASLPIITNIKNGEKQLTELGLSMLKKEIISSDIYYLSESSSPKPIHYEYKVPLVIV